VTWLFKPFYPLTNWVRIPKQYTCSFVLVGSWCVFGEGYDFPIVCGVFFVKTGFGNS